MNEKKWGINHSFPKTQQFSCEYFASHSPLICNVGERWMDELNQFKCIIIIVISTLFSYDRHDVLLIIKIYLRILSCIVSFAYRT